MPKTFTHFLSTSRKHTIGFLVKLFGECCGIRLRCWRPLVNDRQVTVFLLRSLYPCRKIKSRSFTVGIGLWQGCVLSPPLFSLHQGWPN